MEQNLIKKAKEELNNAIERGDDFDTIYSLSLELDKLIAKYYLDKEG